MIPREIPPSVMEAYARLRDLTQETETKLRHVRDADFWGAPVGTPLPLPEGMRLTVPQPVCEEATSLDQLPENLQAFVNNSGTPDNPAHRREFKKTGKVVDVSVADVVEHIDSVLDGVDEETWKIGEEWYQKEHDECVVPWAKEFGISEEVVAGVIAAISPRMPWDKNKEVAHELIRLWQEEDDFGGVDDMAAASILRPNKKGEMVMIGLRENVVQAIRCLRTGDVDASVSGAKRRSFTNNLYDPQAGFDVTNDGWMASMINRMYPDAGFTASECDPWLGHRKTKTVNKVKTDLPGPGGYVIVAEAVRRVAEERGLLPCQIQAIYWIAVGGGTNKPMYPQPKGEKKAAKVISPTWPYTDVSLDPTGGELTDPDYYDAEILRQEEAAGTKRSLNSAYWLIDGRYEWPDQNPRAVVLAKQGELKALLAGFQEAETKLRHVRDAAYWGAPVGTPLPLPRAIKPSTVTIAPSVVPDLDSLPEVPMKKIYRHYGPEKRPNPSKEAIQELADQFNDPPPDHLTDAQKKMHREALKMRAKRLLMHRARWGKRKPVRHDRRMMNIETLRSGDLMMAVSPKNAMRVLREGASKNLFHTGKSISRDTDGWGVDIVSERLILEKALFDIPIDAPPDAHPAYGYLALDDALPNVTSGYGSVVFKLKPSAKEHATVSLMDTFGVEDEPPPMCIPVPMTGEVTPSQLDMAHDEDEGGWADRENLNRGITRNNYAEVQVHGGYTVDEIDTIYLRSTQWQNEERRKKTLAQYEEIKALAEKLGIRVVVERDA